MKSKKIRTKLKMLRASFFIFFFLIFISIIIGLSQAGKTKKKIASEDEENLFSVVIPHDLTIVDEDYKDVPSEYRDVQNKTEEDSSYSNMNDNTFFTSIASKELSKKQISQQSNNSDNSNNEYIQAPSAFDTESGYTSPKDSSDGYTTASSYGNRLAFIKDYLQNSFNGGTAYANENITDESIPSYIQKGRKSALFVSQGGVSVNSNGILEGTSQLSNLLDSGLGSTAKGLMQLSDNKSAYDMQNSQKSKQDFLEQKQNANTNLQTKSNYVQLNTEYVLIAGSIIPIVLLTKINSDLPGKISARVVENVYDTFSGYNLLIPKGTVLVGSYDSEVSWGQLRVLVVWEKLTRPDGVSVALQGMQGTDAQGASGVISRVKTTIGESMAITVLSSLFELGIEYASSHVHSNTGSKSLSDATSKTSSAIVSTATELANKLLDRQPTLTVDPGTESLVFVHYDIELPVFE